MPDIAALGLPTANRKKEFSKEGKKIFVSHSRIHEDSKKSDVKAKKATSSAAPKTVKKAKDNSEKTTFGDIAGLADLKTEMDKNNEK